MFLPFLSIPKTVEKHDSTNLHQKSLIHLDTSYALALKGLGLGKGDGLRRQRKASRERVLGTINRADINKQGNAHQKT